MSDNSRVALVGGAGALAGYLLANRRASGEPVATDNELLNALLQAMAEQTQQINVLLSAISDLLTALQPNGNGEPADGNGETTISLNLDRYFKNLPHIATGVFLLPQANKALTLPSIPIPDNCKIVITALPTNGGFIGIANSKAEAENNLARYPLIAGQGIGLRVKQADGIWVAAAVAGEGVSWIMEQP